MAATITKIKFREPQIDMAHGAGGKASRRLIEGLFAPLLFPSGHGPLGDAAHIQINGTQIAMTTYSFVVKPLRFPGGSIGELAINGTVNDLAVSGAKAGAIVVTYVLEAELRSDTRSVLPVVQALVCKAGAGVRWMRDPTRGGVATSLNELARDCGLGITIFEEQIPVRDEVRGACELLGLDPLHIANEGQFLAVVAAEYVDAAMNALILADGGDGAKVIGEVREQPASAVLVTTRYGGSRMIDMLVGDPL